MGNCKTLSKEGFSFFFSFLCVRRDVPCFQPILSRSDVRPTRVLYIVFVFVNRQLFMSRDMSCDYYFRISSERVSWIVWPSVRILITYILINCKWFVIKLCGISIILLTDLLCGITSYYFSIDLRFDCIFNNLFLTLFIHIIRLHNISSRKRFIIGPFVVDHPFLRRING